MKPDAVELLFHATLGAVLVEAFVAWLALIQLSARWWGRE
jgi:hypothetical protein